jgi:hypothetical protein
MQHTVHFPRANICNAIALLPGRTKPVGIIAAAKETGTMAGRKRGRLVEKEKLGPAPPAITSRRQPLNSQTQVIHAGLDQRFFNKVFVAGSWMMPRLPVNMPRCGVAMMSPVGVTRF